MAANTKNCSCCSCVRSVTTALLTIVPLIFEGHLEFRWPWWRLRDCPAKWSWPWLQSSRCRILFHEGAYIEACQCTTLGLLWMMLLWASHMFYELRPRMRLSTNFGSTFFVRQFLCVQEHLMNTPRQILMYEALGLKVHPSQFFIPFTSFQWYMGGKCREGQRMNRVDRWMIDVRIESVSTVVCFLEQSK